MFQNGEVPIVLEETDETLSRTGLNPSFAAIANPACSLNDQLGIMGMGKDSDAWLDDFLLAASSSLETTNENHQAKCNRPFPYS